MKSMLLLTTIGYFVLANVGIAAPCPIERNAKSAPGPLSDPLFLLLSEAEQCPKDVLELRALLTDEGAVFTTTMVANRGFHNPGAGSFSFFEMAVIPEPQTLAHSVSKDQLLFGHFTAPGESQTLKLDQRNRNGALLIELIVWDPEKEAYNFYELIGSSPLPRWIYQGDSSDIWDDVAKLHLAAPGQNPFGARLRCSGCHLAGGPIMKELSAPHDSWWMPQRPLPLGNWKPDAQVNSVMRTLKPAQELAAATQSGLKKLFAGKAFRKKVESSPAIALRPLFCPEEVNLESALVAFDVLGEQIQLPSAFFFDPRLATGPTLSMPRQVYVDALHTLSSRFPETTRPDADHPWLAPVKAWSDQQAIQQLVETGIIDQEFVADVLAIDPTRPVFSEKRCRLLSFLPKAWSRDWQLQLLANLDQSNVMASSQLASNLRDKERNQQAHQVNVEMTVSRCVEKLQNADLGLGFIRYLDQSRQEISASAISKNPFGQILEPGFRVIFPKFSTTTIPHRWTLDDACDPRL